MNELHLHWFLPTMYDGKFLTPPDGNFRRPTVDYLGDVARAADRYGFESLLTGTGAAFEESWIVAAALTQITKRIKFLVAFRPGFVLPTLAAQMAATFQRMSGDRLLINVVTGGDSFEQRGYGDHLPKDERYARTSEFLDVVRQCWKGERFSYDGVYYQVENGGLAERLDNPPTIYFGGASEAAEEVSLRHAEIQLMWGEPPPMAAQRIAHLRKRAEERGREIRFGIRIHIVTRPTSEEAWAETDRLLAKMTPEMVDRIRQNKARNEAVGAKRLASVQKGRLGSRKDLEIYPNIWAGSGLVMNNNAIVGSYEEVAERVREYHALGIEHFILSGYPSLEEAYWFGEGVTPLLTERTLPRQRQRTGALADAAT